MPLTAAQLADINAQMHEAFVGGTSAFIQNVQAKPLLKELEKRAGTFPAAKDRVTANVDEGSGGLDLTGYSGADQLAFGNPTGVHPIYYPWREHHMGRVITMTELKQAGIQVVENGADQRTVRLSRSEKFTLQNVLTTKDRKMKEDFARAKNELLWGDGTSDAKALAGIRSFILDNPASGSTGGLTRANFTWWRNRAATSAANAAGTGEDEITSTPTNGGALIEFYDIEERQRTRYGGSAASTVRFAGSDHIAAYQRELRANGYYTQNGWQAEGMPDGSMKDPKHGGIPFLYDPWLDDNGYSKRCYTLDLSNEGIRLMFMEGHRYTMHNPARPYDRMVMYNGILMTGCVTAMRLRTSGVYDIA